jgi:hypothetical protein
MTVQPKEFWKFVSIMLKGFEISYDGPASSIFEQYVMIFELLGESLLQKDMNTAWELFQDFALEKFVKLMKIYPGKRSHLVKLIYSFCANDATVHLNAIKLLQEKCDDDITFVQCLPILVTQEENFTSEMLELYVYFSVIGMNASSPTVRSLSLSVLPVIAEHAPGMVFKLIERIKGLSTDDWWEIHAQIIVLCSQLLHSPELTEENCEDIFSLLRNVIANQKNPNISTILLSYIAPHLKAHPSIVDSYTQVLLELPEEERVTLLEQPSDAVDLLQVGSSCTYNIISIPFTWHSIGIAQSLSNYITTQQLDNYEIQHYDIMNACVSTTANLTVATNEKEYFQWLQVFEDNKNYLFAGLCDEELCSMASNLLIKFYRLLREDTMKTMPLLLRSIEVIYRPVRSRASSQLQQQHQSQQQVTTPQVSQRCQEVIPGFLIALYDLGEPFTDPLNKMRLSLMEQKSTHQTPLVDFFEYVMQ